MKIENLVRENIKNLIPYSSARSEFKGKGSVFLDANENPYPNGYNRYPDPLQLELKGHISEWRNIPVKNIMIGNGSDEIIDLIIRVFCNPGSDSVYSFKPGFGMYKVAADINDIAYFDYPLDDNFHLDVDGFLHNIPNRCKVIFICTPINPTGNSIPADDILKLCNKSECIVVVDEAYIDFSDGNSMLSDIENHSNLIVLQTFSKAMGAAGLRIGMAYADERVISWLSAIKMPYNVSKLNQEKAISQFKVLSTKELQINEIKKQRPLVHNILKEHPEVVRIFPSDANFILTKFKNANSMYSYLVSNGVIVRNRSNQFGCNNCLRITIGTPEENSLFAQVLSAYPSIT